jgi:hypothetical protein
MAISDDERFKLRYGPYKTPRFKYGKKVQDEWRGKSDALPRDGHRFTSQHAGLLEKRKSLFIGNFGTTSPAQSEPRASTPRPRKRLSSTSEVTGSRRTTLISKCRATRDSVCTDLLSENFSCRQTPTSHPVESLESPP